MTKRLGCYCRPTQNTVEMGPRSRCAPCPHSDSDEPFQCMFPTVPVQHLAVIYGRQGVRPSRPSSWASMHVPHTLTHLGTWEGTHGGLNLTQWGNTQSGSTRCHEVALRACLGTSVKPHPSFLLLCSCLFTVLPVF